MPTPSSKMECARTHESSVTATPITTYTTEIKPTDPAPAPTPAGTHTELKKVITARQIVFMALGGSIGAGLLVASGQALRMGGPASLLIAFALVGFLVWCTMCSLGELSATYPVQGSFYDYSVRFIAPSWGFSMGWNYVLNFVLIVPFEITVMVLIARYWKPDIQGSYLVPGFIVLLFLIAWGGAAWYAEAEHTFGILKVFVLTLFTLTAIVICAGGVPKDPRHGTGFSYWQEGAFLNGAMGFLSTFVAAGVAYGGTEMMGLTVAEAKNPPRVMPLVAKIVAGRIIICYLIPLFMVSLVLKGAVLLEAPFKDMLQVSPFVAAVRIANIPGLPDFINAAILVAVFSMANASIYASSRALHAICANGMGPRLFSRTTEKRKLPLWALGAVATVSLLAFVNAAPSGAEIFNWLLSLASASNYFTWGSICVSHIRMRRALARRGLTHTLRWRSPVGVWGSVVATAFAVVGLAAQFAAACLPDQDGGRPDGVRTFRSFLGLILVFCLWAGHLSYSLWKNSGDWKKAFLVPLDELDLDTNAVVADVVLVDGEAQAAGIQLSERGVTESGSEERQR